jgi:hypothetical protein
MINMNGFTLGFFFPKQDVAPLAAKPVSAADRNEKAQPAKVTHGAPNDHDDHEQSPLFLYAYRFF